MALQCGIVGLPNVGKSTIFNALTAAEAQAENYPFCTIDPNVGVVPFRDPRLERIAALIKPVAIKVPKVDPEIRVNVWAHFINAAPRSSGRSASS